MRDRKSATFELKDEADWWLRQARRGSAPDAELTVGEYLDRWLKGKRKIVGSTRDQYANHIGHLDALADIPLVKLERRQVERFVDSLGKQKSERTHKPLSAATIGKILTTLRSALEEAVPGDIPDNPAARVEAPRVEREPVRAVTSAEMTRIREAVTGTWLEPVVRFLFGSGLRISEAVTLNQGDVDWAHGTVRLRASKTTRRTVRVTRDGMAALTLLDQPRKGRNEPLFFGERPSKVGVRDRLGRGSVSHALPKLLAAHGIERLTAHGLRHAHATVGLERGTPIEAIAAQLGHRNPTMTRNVYAHVTASLTDEALERLDEAVSER